MRRQYGEDEKVIRQRKLSEVLRREIHEILSREVKDPRIGKFTVTGINLKLDLKSADVLVCRFETNTQESAAEKAEKEKALIKGLESAAHFVYERLKKRLTMKVVPRIRFRFDPSLALASEIWGHIKNTAAKDRGEDLDLENLDENSKDEVHGIAAG